MSVGPNSRYQQGTLIRAADSTGTYQVAVIRTVPSQNPAYSLYTWQPTDRPDIVANQFLGDSTLWWAINDINPELLDPLNIPPGTVLRIPQGPVMGQGILTS